MFSTTLLERSIDDKIRSYHRTAAAQRAMKSTYQTESPRKRRREALLRQLRIEPS